MPKNGPFPGWGALAWGTLEMSAPSNCRAMGETTGVSELQAQHELKPP